MKIGFIAPYSETHNEVYAYHPNFDEIPDMSKIPTYITLPDDYTPQPGMITLSNVKTGELSYIPQKIRFTPGDEIEILKAENAALKERQSITEAALNELIDLTLGGGA